MVDSFVFDNNRMTITKADKVTFDSNAKSVQLFPDSTKISLTNKQVVFPNFLQANSYHRYTGGDAGFGNTYCESWSNLLWQEWGPTEANFNYIGYNTNGRSTRNLPQELLGTVPSETDYLDVRIRLTRTKLPAVMWNTSRPYVLFQEGEWVNLPGGSCPTEEYLPMFFRHFDIVREGTKVYLRRYQSVRNKGTAATVMPSGGTIIDSDAQTSGGWTCSDEGIWPNAPSRAAWLACLVQTKGPDTNGNKRRNGQATNQCNIPGKQVAYPDLGSIFTGDIVIHPGRYE